MLRSLWSMGSGQAGPGDHRGDGDPGGWAGDPSTSLGNNQTWIDCADKVILEVNSTQPMELEGMHDLYYGLGLPPHRDPIPLTTPNQRIGEPYLKIPMEKVIAVVLTDVPDRATAFKAPDENSKAIAGTFWSFWAGR
jgi:succinyl-CoA:acetate CoA-transferase